MKNLQTLKLNASSIRAAAAPSSRPTPIETAPEQPAQVAPAQTDVERPAIRAIRPAGGLRKHMLVLLAVEAAATLAAVAATGSIHNTIFRIAIAGAALTIALLVAIETAVSLRRARPTSAAAATASAAPRRPLPKSRIALLFVMAIGFATYFGGGGTFAGFTAETTNPNQTLASGTLTLRNNVTSNCDSQLGESNNNTNENCNVAFAFTNQEPGVYTGTATVTLTNTGSLNASKLYLWAPYANGVFNGATINPTNTVTTLSLYASGHGPAGLEGTIAGGDLVVVTYGPNSQTFKVGPAGAAPGATSIPIVNDGTYPNVATITISAGATVADTSSDTTAANTDCYDTQQTVYTFNPTTNNPLCSATLLYVQETTGGKNYCWYGSGHGSATGMCDAPISTKPSAVSGGVVAAGSYTVTALTGNIKSGDTLAFTEGANQVTCPASANYYIGVTSITVGACTLVTGANSGFDSNTVITDTTTLGTIASDSSDTISQFDIHKNYGFKQELTPVSANGTLTPTGTDLASSAARTFVVGVVIPGPAAAQNQLQGLKSTFGLTWHIDQ